MKVRFRWTVLLMVLASLHCTSGEISPTTEKHITESVSAAKEVVNQMKGYAARLEEAGKVISPIIGFVGSLAPALGGVSAFLSLLFSFIPKTESAQMKFMKEKFKEVNRKLDGLSDKLDDISTLVTYENQRSIYAEAAHTVKVGSERLDAFFDALEQLSCGNKEECERERSDLAERYVDDFREVGPSLKLILKGAITKSIFRDPFIGLTMKKSKCNIPQITAVTESIFNLAEIGQRVIIAHEKLVASNASVISSLKNYLRLVYKVRKYYYKTKNQCFDKIDDYLQNDIQDDKYQDTKQFSDDTSAINALSTHLKVKYAWLKWNIFSYSFARKDKDDDDRNHAVRINIGWKNEDNRNDRKRLIVATPAQPRATYSEEKHNAINSALGKLMVHGHRFNWNPCDDDHMKCLEAIEKELASKGLKKYIQSIAVLHADLIPSVVQGSFSKYSIINNIFTISYPKGTDSVTIKTYKIHVVIILKSEEMLFKVKDIYCNKDCSHHGTCVRLPYSTSAECQCKAHFDGEYCEKKSENRLANALEMLLLSTLRIPTLSGIRYNLKDLRQEIDTGFGKISVTLDKLSKYLLQFYSRMQKQLGEKFEWTALQISYAEDIKNINYYVKKFKEAREENDKERLLGLSQYVLKIGNLKKWLHELDNLFLGSNSPVIHHSPLMIMYMNKFNDMACSPLYKKNIDTVYQQFEALQTSGYNLWIEALDVMDKNPKKASKKHKKVVQNQEKVFIENTCSYNIPNSKTIGCNGETFGYTHPGMNVTNICDNAFYVKGHEEVNCVDKDSSCQPCSCDQVGSKGVECSKQDGLCNCKKDFYGEKCESRDCKWGTWNTWASCSKSCGYSGFQERKRSHSITQYGEGKHCEGESTESRPCVDVQCCKDEFHCSNKKKCIPMSKKCNYDDDCGDNEDEDDDICTEHCEWRSGPSNWAKGESARMHCGNSQWVLQAINNVKDMISNAINQDVIRRYNPKALAKPVKYKCCKLNKNIMSSNVFNHEMKSEKLRHDDHVECKDDNYINEIRLGDKRYKSSFWDKAEFFLKYTYSCNGPRHGKKYLPQVGYTEWGSKFSWKLTIDCSKRFGPRSFLNSYRIEGNWSRGKRHRYKYVCSRI